jgi:UDP-N-acetylglucosamine diphosphorylase/glucosamine-1-phosphate N-acetyltransferase
MKSELPKVLHPLLGKPLILYVMDNIRKSGVSDIAIVVGYKGEQVEATVGEGVSIVWQQEQLGTGHAVLQAENAVGVFSGNIVVACGDAPLISEASFSKLIAEMDNENVKASVLTMVQDDPSGYGRMVKDSEGNLVRIVEERDASEAEKGIKEVNTGTYIFDAELLFDGLKQIGNNNAQGEYYLPDVLEYIISQGYFVTTMPLTDPVEGSGINSQEELVALEIILKKNRTERV